MKTFIKTVRTNVKSPDGETREWSIGKNTLLLGKNESGKSTIAEAVQLALSGAVSGLLLRPGEVKKGEDLATLIPDGRDTATSWVQFSDSTHAQWELTRGKRAKKSGYIGGKVLPITELKANLSGSTDKALSFLFRAFGTQMTLKELVEDTSTPDAIQDALLEELRLLVDTKEDILSENSLYSPENILACVELTGKLKRDARAKAKALERSLVHFSNSQTVDKLKLYEKWQELFVSLRFEQLKKMYRDNEKLRSFCAQELEKIGSPEKLKALRTSVDLSKEVEALLEEGLKVEMAKRIRADAMEEVQRSKSLDATEKMLREGVRKAAQELLPAYEARVNRFLPEGESFSCDVVSGKFLYGIRRDEHRGVPCRIVHRAMSGSTEVRVLAAMASALVVPSDDVPVLILDDRMWDMDTLRETMIALEDSPCQVIIMSTTRPKGKPRKKWMYVDVAEDGIVPDSK